MKAAILCGGRGTRIREVSGLIPKPMVPVGGRPILWHIMKHYATHGVTDFVLLLGYQGEVIRDFFLNFAARTSDVTIDLSRTGSDRLTFHSVEAEPWKVTLVDTGLDSMTGARLWRARHHLEHGPFLATYGDGIGDIDVTALIAHHRAQGKTATLTGVQPPSRFGELSITGGKVDRFEEKPQVSGGLINGGFFVFEPSFFDGYLSPDEDLVLEREPFEKLAQDGELVVFEHGGFWQPMDTPREFEYLNRVWAEGNAPWKTW